MSSIHGGDLELGHANAILTRDEVAGWLKVRPRQVERLRIPCIDLGRKTKRYLVRDVLAWLDAHRGGAQVGNLARGASAHRNNSSRERVAVAAQQGRSLGCEESKREPSKK